ncbi:MAG: hypothetical protein U0271_17985 [Polyangiaceae bacterium]
MSLRIRQRAGACALFGCVLLAGGVLTACDEPPPPPAEGGFGLTLNDTGVDCNLATHDALVGDVGSSGTNTLATDGLDSAKVSCTVEASATGFFIEASIAKGPSLVVSVDMSSANTADNPATGNVSYVSTDTGGDVYNSPTATPCQFWIEGGEYVQAGAAWVSFSCDEVANEGNTCKVTNGVFEVRNCEGATNDEG